MTATTWAPARPGAGPPAAGPAAAPVRDGQRWARSAACLVVMTLTVVLVGAQQALLAQSVAALFDLRWAWVPVILLADCASRFAVARTHRRLLRAGGARIGPGTALRLGYTANAISVTLLLAGAQLAAAFTYRGFVRAGASPAATSWTLLTAGVASTSTYALLLVVGAVLTATTAGMLLGIGVALLAVLPGWAVLASLRHPTGRRHLSTVLAPLVALWRRLSGARGPSPTAVLQHVLDQLGALRLPAQDRAPVVALALALANWLLDCACLAAAVLAVGADVPWQGLLLAHLTAAGATTLALTPGGLGTVELALCAALVAAGLDAPQALAATLVYRVASLWLPAALGWALYLSAGRGPSAATGSVQ